MSGSAARGVPPAAPSAIYCCDVCGNAPIQGTVFRCTVCRVWGACAAGAAGCSCAHAALTAATRACALASRRQPAATGVRATRTRPTRGGAASRWRRTTRRTRSRRCARRRPPPSRRRRARGRWRGTLKPGALLPRSAPHRAAHAPHRARSTPARWPPWWATPCSAGARPAFASRQKSSPHASPHNARHFLVGSAKRSWLPRAATPT
jgi:hypothetical protein